MACSSSASLQRRSSEQDLRYDRPAGEVREAAGWYHHLWKRVVGSCPLVAATWEEDRAERWAVESAPLFGKYHSFAACLKTALECSRAEGGGGCGGPVTTEIFERIRDLAFYEFLAEQWGCDGEEAARAVSEKTRALPAAAQMLRSLLPEDLVCRHRALTAAQLLEFWLAAADWTASQLQGPGRTDFAMLTAEEVRKNAFRTIKKWRAHQKRKDEDGVRTIENEAKVVRRRGSHLVSEIAQVHDRDRGLHAVVVGPCGRRVALSAVAHRLPALQDAQALVALRMGWHERDAVVLLRERRRGAAVTQPLRLSAAAWPPKRELLLRAVRVSSRPLAEAVSDDCLALACRRSSQPSKVVYAEVPRSALSEEAAARRFASAVFDEEVSFARWPPGGCGDCFVDASRGSKAPAAQEGLEAARPRLDALAPNRALAPTRALFKEACSRLGAALGDARLQLRQLGAADAGGGELTALAAAALAHLWTDSLHAPLPPPSATSLSRAASFLSSAEGQSELSARVLEVRAVDGLGELLAALQSWTSRATAPSRDAAAAPRGSELVAAAEAVTAKAWSLWGSGHEAWLQRLQLQQKLWISGQEEEAKKRIAQRCLAEDRVQPARSWLHLALDEDVCPRCGARETGRFERKDRASDEEPTIIMVCFGCARTLRRVGTGWVLD